MPDRSPAARARREPPTFHPVEVRRTAPLTPHLVRVTLTGANLDRLVPELPAASVRILLPSGPGEPLVRPTWRGNEFLLPDGSRPVIRTYTPRRIDVDAAELDVDIVIHQEGAASAWALTAQPGDPAAVSGPGRGYAADPGAARFVLAGDETAIPAIGQLLEVLPDGPAVDVVVELARPGARVDLPPRPRTTVAWRDLPSGAPPGDALVAAVAAVELDPQDRLWVAGEAAAVQRIRKHLFGERGFDRSHAVVRGYWKHGRRGDTEEGG